MATTPGPRFPDIDTEGVDIRRLIEMLRGGAESAVTGTLGGPVDLATMAMRPMGYDVEKPVGGSEWLRDLLQKAGVYGERTGSSDEGLGELLGGMASPGPGGEEALLGALGGMIRAYHGSPHDFDRFDINKLGSGEGNQAYGHGLYFAENPDVAQSYLDRLGKKEIYVDDEPVAEAFKQVPARAHTMLKDILDGYKSDWGAITQGVEDALKYYRDPRYSGSSQGFRVSQRQDLEAILDAVNGLKAKNPTVRTKNTGKLYTVDIDAEPEQLLDWDKPLKDQSRFVKSSLEDWLDPYHDQDMKGSRIYENFMDEPDNEMGGMGFSEPEFASDTLNSLGIPGLRYWDGLSRRKAKGSKNIVMFDDLPIEIVDKK